MDTKKILIVEDEAPLRKILVEELEDSGYAVFSANDGEEGLTVALKEKPDLILLDLVMPRMGGMHMLDKLREDEWGKNADVLILTNLEGDAKRTIDAMEHGVFEFLVKTRWSLDDLKKRVKEKLGV